MNVFLRGRVQAGKRRGGACARRGGFALDRVLMQTGKHCCLCAQVSDYLDLVLLWVVKV